MQEVRGDDTFTQCTVVTVAGTRLRDGTRFHHDGVDYLCQSDGYHTYRIKGEVLAFIGPAYRSSETTFVFPVSITGGTKIIDLDDDVVKSSITVSNPPPTRSSGVTRSVTGTYKGLIIRVSDSTGDEPVESSNELYGAFFDDATNFGLSVVSRNCCLSFIHSVESLAHGSVTHCWFLFIKLSRILCIKDVQTASLEYHQQQEVH